MYNIKLSKMVEDLSKMPAVVVVTKEIIDQATARIKDVYPYQVNPWMCDLEEHKFRDGAKIW